MVDADYWQDFLLQVSTNQGSFLLDHATQEEFFHRVLTTFESNPRRIIINSVLTLTHDVFELLEGMHKGEEYIVRGET